MLALFLVQTTTTHAQQPPPTPTPTPLPGPPLAELNEDNIKRATVFVMQVLDLEEGPIITCVGSGTLVSADGLILTNAHITVESDACPADRTVIALTLRVDEPPVPTYVASLLDFSTGLDLAVLRITSFLDGRIVEPGLLQLPFVELGDSGRVNLDDTILVVGYPDIGNTPVEAIRSTVSGFTSEARVGNRAWLRSSAPIPGVVTGGGAYDREGRLIGVPTIAPALIGEQALDCRSVQDSNGDGQVNDDDVCIPVGGFISALRPSRLARGLVRASALGIHLGADFAPARPPLPQEAPLFDRLLVSSGVNSAGMPINVVNSLPTGATSMYLFFDYNHMVNGYIYELRTSINGRPNPTFSLPPVTWNGGERGLWYIGATGIPLPNGTYTFALFIQGRQVASHELIVGGGPSQEPTFTDISFGLQDNLGNIVGTNYVIPETNIVRAQFNYRNMTPDMEWTQVWYLEDSVLARTPLPWTGETQGVNTEAAIQSPTGLISGHYRLELLIEDRLVATSDFVVAGGAEATQADIFSNFQFSGDQVGGQPQPPIGEQFVSGTQELFVFFDWRQLSQGTPWTWRWKVDGDTLFEVNTQWAAAPDGQLYYLSLEGDPALPDATYTLEIEMGGILVASAQARVGLGRLPLDAFASAEGVTVSGRILDNESQQGIAGAMFIMLLPEFSVEDFLWDENQILAVSLADEDGFFQLPALLQRGTLDTPVLYSMLVRADGYLPMSADGIPITDQTESPFEIVVEMSRD
jgi:hypothetical protein